jgi:hypothetical protein
MKGITVNGRPLEDLINIEISIEISMMRKEENKVNIYHAPSKGKGWSPYKCRSSKVRKVEVK